MIHPHQVLDAVGHSYKDFVVTKYLPINELQSTLVELVHRPTGASIVHIANDDPENLFCLSFQTLPSSSNGVAHILEHTVLCGSKKYPIKDPFFSMAKRSLNTFMNALTGQDFTCYPASSQVEKDFYNLLEVYLDAVFHPELKELSFLQEGHRFEFAEAENPESALQYQGVVYNEMKGDMTSSDSRLWKALCKNLMPDLTYAHNSGGDPLDIPSLSYEELIDFHKTFYHPSRCLFFFYGNIPLAKHLDFIQEKGLDGVKPVAPLPPLPLQRRFESPILAFDSYPIAQFESLEKKTHIAFGWLTVPLANQADLLALSLLDNLLMDTDASPLKLALLKSGLCTQASSSIDAEMSEVPWIVVCKGCEAKDGEKLKELIFTTLKQIASHPFSPEQIEACLHQLEFERTEINAEGGPFGLTLFMRAALIRQHGSESENGLFIHSLFDQLRSRLLDPNYLPQLIEKWLINNTHCVELILSPDPELHAKEAKIEHDRLGAIRAKMSDAEIQKVIDQAKELAAYQEAVEHQSIDCLPKVTLQDVPPHARNFPLIQMEIPKLTIFHHNCFTNKILYADLIFDLPEVKIQDLSLLSLLSRFLPELGTKNYTYNQMLERAQAYTGGINTAISLHPTQKDPNICKPTFALRGKALARNSEKLFELFTDLISGADFKDEARVKELFAQHLTSLQNRLVKNGMNYAIQTCLAGFSIPSFINDHWNGISYYRAVKKWSENTDQLIFDLNRLQQELLCTNHPQLVIGCDDELRQTLEKHSFYDLGFSLPTQELPSWKGHYTPEEIPSQARFIASPVAFTALGMRTVSYSSPEAPFLSLATELLQNCILHKEIREKGGAYGSAAVYIPTTGNFYFYSYRDPQLSKTIDTFHKSIEKIGSMKFTEQELEEAKLGIIQGIDAPVSPSARAMTSYAWMRVGRTPAMREQFRAKILNATRKEVAKAIETCILPAKKSLVSFLGQELFEKEQKKLKMPLLVLPID